MGPQPLMGWAGTHYSVGMKTWILIAAAVLAPLSASAQHPQPGAADEKVRASLLTDLEAYRVAFLPKTTPVSPVTARYEPRLNDLKKTVAAAKTSAALEKARKDFSDWQTVVLAELFNPGMVAPAGAPVGGGAFGVPPAVTAFSAKRIEQQATMVRSLTARSADTWSGAFDQSTAFRADPFAAPGAVLAMAPPAAHDPARYAKIRALLLSKGVNPKIVDTAIAEGIRQKVDPMIVLSVIDQESDFKKNAYNKGSGCTGLMQLDPDTAADMGVHGSLYDIGANIKAGTKYLNWIANSFFKMGQDLSDMSKVPADKLKMILASYNWGVGNVRKTIKKHGVAALDRVAPKETRNYIAEIPSRIYDWFASF